MSNRSLLVRSSLSRPLMRNQRKSSNRLSSRLLSRMNHKIRLFKISSISTYWNYRKRIRNRRRIHRRRNRRRVRRMK